MISRETLKATNLLSVISFSPTIAVGFGLPLQLLVMKWFEFRCQSKKLLSVHFSSNFHFPSNLWLCKDCDCDFALFSKIYSFSTATVSGRQEAENDRASLALATYVTELEPLAIFSLLPFSRDPLWVRV